MCDDWITSHALVWKQIQACKKHQAEIEALGYEPEYAWTKHEGSCAAFGGCFMRDCCEGLTTPEAGPYCKSEKWKKANGGTK
jgi:hypothetical protein